MWAILKYRQPAAEILILKTQILNNLLNAPYEALV